MKSKRSTTKTRSNAATKARFDTFALMADNDEAFLPPHVEVDALSRLLDRRQSRGCADALSPYADEGQDEHDFPGEEALHRVIEDLQFGYELR